MLCDFANKIKSVLEVIDMQEARNLIKLYELKFKYYTAV